MGKSMKCYFRKRTVALLRKVKTHSSFYSVGSLPVDQNPAELEISQFIFHDGIGISDHSDLWTQRGQLKI